MIDAETHVLVTGGTGFIGTHLRQRLTSLGCEVSLLVRPESPVDQRQNETIIRGDVTESLQEKLENISPDVVCHLAAQTSISQAIDNPRYTWSVNADGTLNILEAIRGSSIDSFLYVSTASIYGKPTYLPIDETHPANAREPYGASKLAGERLAMSYCSTYDLPVTGVRVFNAFGPGQPEYNVVPTIISQALDSEAVRLGNLSPSRDFIYVKDVIKGIIAVLEQGTAGEIYNLGRGEDISVRNMAEIVISLCSRDIPIQSAKDRQRDESVEIPRHVANIDKALGLNWEPTWSIEDGLEATIEAWGKYPD